MSIVKVQGNATGTGIFTIAAPSGNTDRTLTLPDETGTVLINGTSSSVSIGTATSAEKLYLYSGSGNTKLRADSGSNQVYMGWDGADAIAEVATNGAWRVRTGSGFTERARIDSSGNYLFGKTAADDSTTGFAYRSSGYISAARNGGAPCYFNRTGTDGAVVEIANDGSTVGSISVSGSSTAYNTSSDYRLKQDIQPMQNALAKVAALKPVTYKWKVDGSDGEGFIAHELQAVVPDCVTGAKDAVDADGKPVYQGIDTSFLVATLTAAIQELKAELDSVKTELATLKGAA